MSDSVNPFEDRTLPWRRTMLDSETKNYVQCLPPGQVRTRNVARLGEVADEIILVIEKELER